LVIVANRDESYGRRSQGPGFKQVNGVRMMMPHDELKGGTWMGVTENAWFVGITNQDAGRIDTVFSRGHVVQAAIEYGCHRDVAMQLMKLNDEYYNPFNLVFGKPGALFVSTWMKDFPLEMVPLQDAVCVVSNDCVGSNYNRKVARAKLRVSELLVTTQAPGEILHGLLGVMADHASALPNDPFQGLCVHSEEHHWGTRSTSMVTVSNQGVVEYWYSEGPACESTGFVRSGQFCIPKATPDEENDPV
jgi:uncharacterized protein with NRDE domain